MARLITTMAVVSGERRFQLSAKAKAAENPLLAQVYGGKKVLEPFACLQWHHVRWRWRNDAAQQSCPCRTGFAHFVQIFMLIVNARHPFARVPDNHFRHRVRHS